MCVFFYNTCFAFTKGQSGRLLSAIGCCPCRGLFFAACRKAYAEILFLRPKAAAIRLVTAPVRMF